MGIYEELHVPRIINAMGTYTIYGGSKMSSQTIEDMKDAAASFIDLNLLQKKTGQAIARLTLNEPPPSQRTSNPAGMSRSSFTKAVASSITAWNSLLRCETSRTDRPVPAKLRIASAVFWIVYSLRIEGPA